MEFLYSQLAVLQEKFTLHATAVANGFERIDRVIDRIHETLDEFRFNIRDLAKSHSDLADTVQTMLDVQLQTMTLLKGQSEQPKAIDDLTRRVEAIEKRLGPPPEESS